MKHIHGFFWALVIIPILAACGSTQSSPPSSSRSSVSANIAAGRQLYNHVCYYCHGRHGQGGVRMGAPQLWGPGNAIKGGSYDNQQALAQFIQQAMPPMTVNGVKSGSLSTAQANNVAAYILSKNK